MVVHLGGVGGEIFEEERALRKMHDAGTKDGDEFAALGKRAAERRGRDKSRFFPAARRSLAEIAEYAEKRGVTVGLENRYHFHEFPDPDECAELIADYPPHVAGFWLDVGHAEVLDRLGLIPHDRWLNGLSARCVGAHVHDVDGLLDHRAPGHGTADWPHYAAMLPPDAPRICEINQRVPEDQVAAAIPYLRSVGVLPAE
jgi:sugar phosphate isomerase/epimerase